MKKEFLPLIFYIIFSCGTKNESINNILPGNDPNFKIISHNDIGFESTNRKVDVFGLYIYAYPEVDDLNYYILPILWLSILIMMRMEMLIIHF